MGEIVELVLVGAICQICGTTVDGIAPGYPRDCEDCKEEEEDLI